MTTAALLIELGTEELPPKAVAKLADTLAHSMHDQLQQAQLVAADADLQVFATPRRLAFLLAGVADQQPQQHIERRGPAVAAAYDADGNPTKALQGFARSCGVTAEQLSREVTDKGEWLFYRASAPGQSLADLLPAMLQRAIKQLPIPKLMRWGNNEVEFVRPAHWLMVLHGNKVVPVTLLNCHSDRLTYGHRTHSPGAISLDQAVDYEAQLQQHFVMADANKRRERIQTQATELARAMQGQVVLDSDLLNEVVQIVEWPVALCCSFDAAFLKVPQEALISSMQGHQKCFAVVDDNGKLIPAFISISNLESTDATQVVQGNEKVMAARLADAKFFFEQDQKTPLETHLLTLDKVTFQQQLGSLADKVRRIESLSLTMAQQAQLDIDTAQLSRAALLCKADLMSQMVMEFPELQGTMGKYYAQLEGEPTAVAAALEQHYQPRFSGDALPEGDIAALIALADKLDTLVGIFGIGQKPTGSKDPFALRRSALGMIRILQHKAYGLEVRQLISSAAQAYAGKLSVKTVVDDVMAFVHERLRVSYREQGQDHDVIAAVLAKPMTSLHDVDLRIVALEQFMQLPQAPQLIAAHKRVANILAKQTLDVHNNIDPELLQDSAERALSQALHTTQAAVAQLQDYRQYLHALADLQAPLDQFFDNVMVMAEDKALRQNRLRLLAQIEQLLSHVADLSLLHC
jgi:glycyl-tRNA synthetase beta chain